MKPSTTRSDVFHLALAIAAVFLVAGCGDSPSQFSSEIFLNTRYIGAVGLSPDGRYAKYENQEGTDVKLEENVKNTSELMSLRLINTDATNNGLEYVGNHENLEILFINGAKFITDKGLEKLVEVPKLRELTIIGTNVTDDGMKHLKEFPRLQKLTVDGLTDDGLEFLKELPRLEILDLLNCRISDRGLNHLAGISNLKYLTLFNCEISAPVFDRLTERLTKRLPNCKIRRQDSTPN